MRKKIIAGNWKMNNTAKEAEALLGELVPMVADAKCEVVVCVPFTALCTASKLVKNTNIKLGAQNVSWADKGAFTGEISCDMLKDFGVEYVILGHSERRQMFGETDATVNKRLIQAIKNELVPIVCVGESESQRENGETNAVVCQQIDRAFESVTREAAVNVVVAYEPIWAIGTGKTATSEDANDTIKVIRAELSKLYGKETADSITIQYGGSMNAKNSAELMAMSDIDGGLIGGASLKASDFEVIIKNAK